MIIAIDGPAASGKGTLRKRLAEHYRLRYLDTGLIYRALAKSMLDRGQRLDDAEQAVRAAAALDPTTFDAADLNGMRSARLPPSSRPSPRLGGPCSHSSASSGAPLPVPCSTAVT